MTAAAAPITWRQRMRRVIFFFPFQLLMLHLKKNHFLLFFWVMLFGLTLRWVGAKYGIDHQFLFPEYLGKTGFVSFAILGFALGGFILAFNLYTYILHGFRFPFIATLSRPFLKFSINNFILPGLYLVVYFWRSVDYQLHQQFITPGAVVTNLLGLCTGIILLWILTVLYFSLTNKNALNYGQNRSKRQREEADNLVASPIHRQQKWYTSGKGRGSWHVETYMLNLHKIVLARKSLHYPKEVLEKVFSQNHINASLFEIILIITFILIGSSRESSFFVIPAGASVVLFFTMALMLISAIFSWIKGWTLTIFIAVFLMLNYSFSDLTWLNLPNHAYGLDYDVKPADYLPEHNSGASDSLHQADFMHMLGALDNWRKKHLKEAVLTGKKPKLVIVNASGGGSRAALWTMSSLLAAESNLGNEFLDKVFLITGSSGGMVGAAYLRELRYMQSQGAPLNPFDSVYCENIGKDLLNPVIFSIATNDFFIRYQKFEDGGRIYTKDRAYSFEQQFNMNTEGVLDKRLGDYTLPEYRAEIPLMILSPTIINDGRRMIISSQPVSFLTDNHPRNNFMSNPLQEDVEFTSMFEKQDAMNLKFTSALRMNATFPYILPAVTLPSVPPIDVMDAGLRDNFGIKTTLQFLYTFRNWIKTNTGGVIILQVRDIQKDFEARASEPTLISKFTAPLGTMYGNFTKMQDYNSDQMLRYFTSWYGAEVDIVTFQLFQSQESRISLSWHLTEAEKRTIKSAVESEEFHRSIEELRALLELSE